jgi:hypothetical protein
MSCSEVSLKIQPYTTIREQCRFIGFRRMKPAQNGHWTVSFDEKAIQEDEGDELEFNGNWKPPRTADDIDVVQVWPSLFCGPISYLVHSMQPLWLCCRS